MTRIGSLRLKSVYFTLLLAVAAAGAIWEFLRRRPDHPFRDVRFVFFIFILIPVQTLFAHNWLTIPYYLDRAFSGTGVSRYFEVFSNLNPVLIFVLSPLIAALTARRNVYRMMIAGTFVMALPTFLLAVGPNVYLFLLYILVMSVGEAMWQPRFLQWVAEIAPEGKTGLYMGIGQFPWFLTKLITSLYSGYVIARYCPKPELGLPMRTGAMWLIYALIAMVSPVALVLARKWMAKGMARRG
jgi:MFS family permease